MAESREVGIPSHAEGYATLWARYCAAGQPTGSGPAGVAHWAFIQALAYVCPMTARRIAAAVLAAGQAAQAGGAGSVTPSTWGWTRASLVQCAHCATVASRRGLPHGWLRV